MNSVGLRFSSAAESLTHLFDGPFFGEVSHLNIFCSRSLRKDQVTAAAGCFVRLRCFINARATGKCCSVYRKKLCRQYHNQISAVFSIEVH